MLFQKNSDDQSLKDLLEKQHQQTKHQKGKTHKGRKLENEETCPSTELYVQWFQKRVTNTRIVVNDHRIRKTDQGQVLVGTYYEDYTNDIRHCFIARLSKRGAYLSSTYFNNKHPAASQDPQYYSECNAVTLTTNEEVIAVGTYRVRTTGARSALIIKSEYDDGDTVTNELTNDVIIRMWAPSNEQIGRDVTTTDDGGIYVTGSVSGYSQGGWDCFILRLNHTLDRVYVKSFGSSENEYCTSIQVTRNNDYIYLGGHRTITATGKQEMMFFKLTAYADTFVQTRFLQSSGVDTLELRRILLTQDQAFTATNDANNLFFCGSIATSNNGDFIYGYLDSAFVLQRTYRYGSPGSEKVGDCALTSDNKYLIGLFSSSYYKPRVGSSASAEFNITIAMTAAQSLPYGNPCHHFQKPGATPGFIFGTLGTVKCKPLTASQASTDADYSTAEASCTTAVANGLTTYISNYNSNLYSWTTCENVVFKFDNIGCAIDGSSLTFTGCTGGVATECETFGGNTQCDIFNCTAMAQEIDFTGAGFPSGYFNVKRDVFFNVQAITPRNSWESQMFCDQRRTPTTDDIFELVFEQDCTDDPYAPDLSYDWFLIRIKVSDIIAGTMASMPEQAAYFGDREGDEQGTSIQVDDEGYISISGTSNSENFGAVDSGEYVWLHAKTHWDFHWEVKRTTTYDSVRYISYMGKRFIQPKKFKNEAGHTFLVNYLLATESTSGTYDTTNILRTPLAINENLGTQPGNITEGLLYIYFTGAKAFFSWFQEEYGSSYYSMNNQLEFRVQKNRYFSFTAPIACTNTTDSRDYTIRIYEFNSDTATGVSMNFVNDNSALPVLSGNLTLAQGVYYATILGLGYRFDYDPTLFECPMDDHWNSYNDDISPALKRFQVMQRLKFIVDDIYVLPPSLAKSIPDITITVGHRYNTVNVKSYFQGTCTYIKARQAKLSGTYNSYMMPYWIQFSELNGTFTIYPPLVTNPPISTVSNDPVALEVRCCNNIYECAISTFNVYVTDQDPELDDDIFQTDYVMHYDSEEDVGQHFDWYANAQLFSDDDYVTGDTVNDPYSQQAHTVWVSFTSVTNGFDHIKWMGLMFGQAIDVSSSNLGSNTLRFQYQDQYSASQIFTNSFMIYINRLPERTTAGFSYKFSQVDPSLPVWNTTYFDENLPQVEDGITDYMLDVDISQWFTDLDTSDTLRYSLSYSDATLRPQWLGFDLQSGLLRGFPPLNSPSELLNLHFSAFDLSNGQRSLYKTMLVNSKPARTKLYHSVVISRGRDFRLKIAPFFSDPNADHLTYYLAKSDDQERLRDAGLDFYLGQAVLAGKPNKITVFGAIEVVAADPHGATNSLYLTIRVEDTQPDFTDDKRTLATVTIIEDMRFTFALPNDVFRDIVGQQPLIVFVSTQEDVELPQWLKFNPLAQTFYGKAPLYKSNEASLQVQVRAMHQESHASRSLEFTLIIEPNSNPKPILQYMPADLLLTHGESFSYILPIGMFSDYDLNYQPKLEIFPAFGASALPQWLSFDSESRTLKGIAVYNLKQAWFRVDVKFTDDTGKSAYANFKVTVRQQAESAVAKWFIAINVSCIGGIMIYLVYFMQYKLGLRPKEQIDIDHDVAKKRSKRRFGRYRDINVEYLKNNNHNNLDTYDGEALDEVNDTEPQQQDGQLIHTYNVPFDVKRHWLVK